MHSEVPKEYFCIYCQKTFAEWKNFKRHGKEVHEASDLYSCKFCSYTTKRRHDLERHTRAKHKCQKIVASLVYDLVAEVEGSNIDICDYHGQFVNDSVEYIGQLEETYEVDQPTDDESAQDVPVSLDNGKYVHDLCDKVLISVLDDVLTSVGKGSHTSDLEQVSESNAEHSDEELFNRPIGEIPDADGLCEYERIRNQNIAEIQAVFWNIFPPKSKKSKVVRKKKDVVSSAPTRYSSRLQSRASEVLAQTDSEVQNANDCDSRSEDMMENVGKGDQELDCDSVVEDEITDGRIIFTTSSSVSEIETEVQVMDCESDVEKGSLSNQSDDEVVQFENLEDEVSGKYCCLPCGVSFGSNNNLKRHVRLLHQPRKNPVKCPRPWCQMEFRVRDQMIAHKKNA